MNCLVDKALGCNYQMVKEPGNRCSTQESEVKEPDPVRQVELDKEPSIHDVSAAIESCFGADAIADFSQPAELSGAKMDVSETHLSEEMKHGLRVKEVELETLISSAGATDSSVHVPMNEQMEEGEAFGDFMVFDESDYNILNDVGNEKKDEANESPADIFGREEFAFDVHVNAPQRKDAYASSSVNVVDEDNTFVGGEFIRKLREEPQDNTQKVFCSKDVETRKVCVYDTILDGENDAKKIGRDVKLDHPAGSQFDSTSGVNAKKRKHVKVDAENENIGKNEKKRGPLTMESKAKKKAKDRLKRAEERIKLGVKRLKLPPVMKPKVVKYCLHYRKGRCLEGEKCNFSHDTIPLTKSKPCCHFARQTCMKGDDCPFDHQLSKYPCEKYASQGFCNRGSRCLFSHEVTAKTEAVTSPIASNSLIQVNTNGMSHRDVNSTSSSTGLVPSNSTERTVLEHVRKPAALTPKGITFLSRGKSLQGDAIKHEEVGLSSKADDVDNIQKPNGFMKGASMRTPQGINFLSFGRAPSSEPSGDTLSGMLNMDYGVDKLQLVDMKAKLGSINQMSTRTPPGSVPRGVNFLSVDKAVEDRSHPNECLSASSPIQRRHNAPNTTSSEMPFRQLSSLFPAGQSLIQSAQKCNAEIASSSKAPLLANTPSSIQKALQSTLAFAAKFDLGVKYGMSNGSRH
ncbi:zinc finger CCCH domain-containing protein 65 isoform X2 [Solanum dulcamara]|nr:zinc finger CCCH domain-containing protein 65 isoform X2 [Solanum dulcamara]